MTQVWLTLMAMLFAYFAVNEQESVTTARFWVILSLIMVTMSVILFFVNGGTTG